MGLVELYQDPFHKARVVCHFRRLTNAQQHEVKPVYTKMARAAKRAADIRKAFMFHTASIIYPPQMSHRSAYMSDSWL